MLVDQIMDAGSMGFSPGLMAPMKDRIRRATKFVLDPAFAAAADALSAEYGTLVKAFPFCRLPFPETWIEVAQHERPQFLAAGVHAPAFQRKPHRVGFLCSATREDLSAWRAHLFWVIPDTGCSCAGMAMDFDMSRGDDVEYSLEVSSLGKKHPDLFTNVARMSHPG